MCEWIQNIKLNWKRCQKTTFELTKGVNEGGLRNDWVRINFDFVSKCFETKSPFLSDLSIFFKTRYYTMLCPILGHFSEFCSNFFWLASPPLQAYSPLASACSSREPHKWAEWAHELREPQWFATLPESGLARHAQRTFAFTNTHTHTHTLGTYSTRAINPHTHTLPGGCGVGVLWKEAGKVAGWPRCYPFCVMFPRSRVFYATPSLGKKGPDFYTVGAPRSLPEASRN